MHNHVAYGTWLCAEGLGGEVVRVCGGVSLQGGTALQRGVPADGAIISSCIRSGAGRGNRPDRAAVLQGAAMRRSDWPAGTSWRVLAPEGQRTSMAFGGLPGVYPKKHAGDDWLQ